MRDADKRGPDNRERVATCELHFYRVMDEIRALPQEDLLGRSLMMKDGLSDKTNKHFQKGPSLIEFEYVYWEGGVPVYKKLRHRKEQIRDVVKRCRFISGYRDRFKENSMYADESDMLCRYVVMSNDDRMTFTFSMCDDDLYFGWRSFLGQISFIE